MSSVDLFPDPLDSDTDAPITPEEEVEVSVSQEEPQDATVEIVTGRILGVDLLATASDLGII